MPLVDQRPVNSTSEIEGNCALHDSVWARGALTGPGVPAGALGRQRFRKRLLMTATSARWITQLRNARTRSAPPIITAVVPGSIEL